MNPEPDSTFSEGEVDASHVIASSNESEAAAVTEIECNIEATLKKDDHFSSGKEEVVSNKTGDSCTACQTDRCPVCVFMDYLGEVVPQPIQDVLTWKDLYKTGVIFFTVLPLLILYCYCNPIVVTAYLLLGLVTSTFTYRVFRYVLDTLQKSEVANPFANFADIDVATSRQVINGWVDFALPVAVRVFNRVKHFVLVVEVLDTIKFALLLYVIAVIGGYFSVRVLLILAFVGTFTLPKVYELYKVPITGSFQQLHEAIIKVLKQANRKIREVRGLPSSKSKQQ